MLGGWRLAIIGSRDFNDYELLKRTLEPYKHGIEMIISGGAKGADSLGERWAYENNIGFVKFLPDWNKHGKSAGFIRNIEIIDNCDCCIAFWDGESHGTKHSIGICESRKTPLKIINYKLVSPK